MVALLYGRIKRVHIDVNDLARRHLGFAMKTEVQARLDSLPKTEASFIEPMECALVSKLPEGPDWTYEVKFDGYRAIGVKTSDEGIIYSRNGKNFNKRYPDIAEALADLPADSVIDGEIVALDEWGRPDFHRLQHFAAEAARIHYFVFDLLISNGRDLTKLPLSKRRKLFAKLKLRSPRIRISEQFEIPAADMVSAVRQQQLEGVVAKRKSSRYSFLGLAESIRSSLDTIAARISSILLAFAMALCRRLAEWFSH